MSGNKQLAVLCLALTVFLSGCWDRREIEQLAFVTAVAVDPAPERAKPPEPGVKHLPEPYGEAKYQFTFEIPIAKAPQGEGGNGGQGGGDEWLLTSYGESLFMAQRIASARSEREISFEHLNAIVISEAVAREGILPVLDLFFRRPEVRELTKVFITPDQARDVLAVKRRGPDYTGVQLVKILRNEHATATFASRTNLGEVGKSIHQRSAFALPVVLVEADEVKVAGLAVFRGDRMVARFDERETMGAKLLRGIARGGVIQAAGSANQAARSALPGLFALEVTQATRKIKTEVVNGQARFIVDINIKGQLAEKTGPLTDTINPQITETMEKAFTQSIKADILRSLTKTKQYGADLVGLGRLIKQNHPRYWREVKEQWPEVYRTVPIEVNVKVEVQRVGIQR